MRLIKSFIFTLSSYLSIAGVYFTVIPLGDDRPIWHWILIAVFGLLSIFSFFHDYTNFSNEKHTTYSSTVKVNKFMKRWVENEGQTVIFSRDLSWGGEFDIKSTLLAKARKSQLKIFLQKKTDLALELEAEGAEIIEYGNGSFDPKSRFTIVGAGKEGARVAIGTKRKGKHVVYEFESGEDPVFAIAQDLTEMLKKLC